MKRTPKLHPLLGMLTDDEKRTLAYAQRALPCPFCGADAEAEPWHGGGLRKHHVGCSNDGCATQPGCCGATLHMAVAAWNRRTPRSGRHAGEAEGGCVTRDDDARDYYGDDDCACEKCGGRGYVIVCFDDLCANSDRCIHGDGERVCPECGGQS